jgi:hypothetical protein
MLANRGRKKPSDVPEEQNKAGRRATSVGGLGLGARCVQNLPTRALFRDVGLMVRTLTISAARIYIPDMVRILIGRQLRENGRW